jgi:integrase
MSKKRYATHVSLPNGDRVYVSAGSKTELKEKVLNAKMQIRAGVNLSDKTLFRDYAETWFRINKTPPRIRESSSATLRCYFDKHVKPAFGELTLREIKATHIQMFLNAIAYLSRSSQKKCWQMMQGILASAQDDGLISRIPVKRTDKISGAAETVEEPLTVEQSNALLHALEGTRAYGFCLIALSTGLRRGEIIGLMWSDIAWDEGEYGVIHVQHQKAFLADRNDAPVTTELKTAAAYRPVPLTSRLRAWLDTERESSRSLYVLSMRNGESLTKGSFRALWGLVRERTASHMDKLTPGALDFDSHPHLLRHTYATRLFEAGIDVKQVQFLMGHEKPEMTMRIYIHYQHTMRAKETEQKVHAALAHLIA